MLLNLLVNMNIPSPILIFALTLLLMLNLDKLDLWYQIILVMFFMKYV